MFMMSYVEKAKSDLEKLLGCSIEVVEDRDSRYPAKMEYARNYKSKECSPTPGRVLYNIAMRRGRKK